MTAKKSVSKPKLKTEAKVESIFILVESVKQGNGVSTSALNLPNGALIRSESTQSIVTEYVPGINYVQAEEVFLPIH